MNCTNCGKEVPDTAKVCGYCGHQLKAVHVPTPAPTPTPKTEPRKKLSSWIWVIAILGALLLIGVVAVAIVLLVPIRIDLGLSPNNQVQPIPNNPPALESTPIPTTLPDLSQATSPTAKPTLYLSPTPAQTQIVVKPFASENDGTMLRDLSEETSPGNWIAQFSSDTSVIIGWGWCASTQEILDQNLQHMKFQFFVDGLDVTGSMTQFQGPIEGGICHMYRGVIRSWPVGQHTILNKMVFLQKVNDGEKDYEGTITQTFSVNVSP